MLLLAPEQLHQVEPATTTLGILRVQSGVLARLQALRQENDGTQSNGKSHHRLVHSRRRIRSTSLRPIRSLLTDSCPLPSHYLPATVALDEYVCPPEAATNVFTFVATFIRAAVSGHSHIAIHSHFHIVGLGRLKFQITRFDVI